MRIAESNIAMRSSHFLTERHSVKESLRFWINNQNNDFAAEESQQRNGNPPAVLNSIGHRPDINSIYQRALRANQGNAINTPPVQNKASAAQKNIQKSDEDRSDILADTEFGWKLELIKTVFEQFFGKKIDTSFFEDMMELNEKRANIRENTAEMQEKMRRAASQGWGLEYRREENHYEKEITEFNAEGIVNTADGKQIRFDFQLKMNRELEEKYETKVLAGDAKRKDPLVINFNGTAAQLTGRKFDFDIDSDGNSEKISFVKQGSGFLAFDKNADGIINNGGELFGAETGNGFTELAAYDIDNNGWIDENDSVFNKLSLWTKDASGNDSLSPLLGKNVGAVYLQNSATPFQIKSGYYNEQGEVKSSGIYLTEDGRAGSVQQIDLFV